LSIPTELSSRGPMPRTFRD